jgi:putative ABC transport system permease protein
MMLSPRWTKLWRDLQLAQGRMLMIVLAIAVSIFGVGSILSAYTILNREISRNYLGTNPASAFIELDKAEEAASAVRQLPEVADAEATGWVQARIEIQPNDWRTLLLFVVPDFSALRIDKFQADSGAWPPPEGTLLMEREALQYIENQVGAKLNVQLPSGVQRSVQISGTVHDPGLAPAWQEQMAYGYVTPATLKWLGSSQPPQILKVIYKDQPYDSAAVDAATSRLAGWLKDKGYQVGEIRLPPPGKHPHQSQMNAILILLLAFSILALILSAILTATMVNALLAQQIRQIGILKAIGARSAQISTMYLALVLVLGGVAAAVGIPLGILVGQGLAGVVGQLLNFTIYSQAVPGWVQVVLLGMGLLVPPLVASIPIARTTRTTVREILNDYGTNSQSFGASGLDGLLSRMRGLDNLFALALRNTFRRRTRLLLTLGLLAAAGAMFMTGINVEASWRRFLADSVASRRYSLEVRLGSPQAEENVLKALAAVPGVQTVETWNLAPAALDRPDGLDVVRTYPDGGHGSFSLRSAPADSQMLDLKVQSGRWLQAGDANGVVLNQLAAAFFPGVRTGDEISLLVNGHKSSLRVVGIVTQLMSPAAAYVSPETYASAAGTGARSSNALFITFNTSDAAAINRMTGAISIALADKGIPVKLLIPRTLLEGASDAHVYVFIYSLLFMAGVMGVVGALGLMSSMGTSVVERTREFGVMRALGARAGAVRQNVLIEGLLTGLMSWLLAVGLSVLPSLVVDNLLGSLFSRVPLTLIVSPLAVAAWFGIVLLGSLAASLYPAWQASRLTVRETLAYV